MGSFLFLFLLKCTLNHTKKYASCKYPLENLKLVFFRIFFSEFFLRKVDIPLHNL